MIRNDYDNVACVNNKMISYQTPAFFFLHLYHIATLSRSKSTVCSVPLSAA